MKSAKVGIVLDLDDVILSECYCTPDGIVANGSTVEHIAEDSG